MKPIGIVRTPYDRDAPYQPVPDAEGTFVLELEPQYVAGLEGLASFRYAYVVYACDRLRGPRAMVVHPPWTPEGFHVGVFASRSPARPNPIGISIVEVRRVEGHRVHTSGLDAFDGTPLLDIKPYIASLDVRDDANRGWVDTLPDDGHLDLHIRGGWTAIVMSAWLLRHRRRVSRTTSIQ